MELEDELELIKSIYCQKGEFEMLSANGSKQPTFKLRLTHSNLDLQMTIYVPEGYPASVPKVTLQSPSMSRENTAAFNEGVSRFLLLCTMDSSMLLELITWIRDNISRFSDVAKVKLLEQPHCDKAETCLMQIDHMRSRNHYLKILIRWAEELDLIGGVIFFRNFIFSIVSGAKKSTTEFVKRLRTQNVDVDSRGHPCKERMMTILERFEPDSPLSVGGFIIHDVSTQDELVKIFEKFSLQRQFRDFVAPNIS